MDIPEPTRVLFDLTFRIRSQPDTATGLYESYCVELGTASCGKTIEQALENLREACDLELETFERPGELIDYLKEHDIEVHTDGDAIRELERRSSVMRHVEPDTLSTLVRMSRDLTPA